jgi:hypothetical protein
VKLRAPCPRMTCWGEFSPNSASENRAAPRRTGLHQSKIRKASLAPQAPDDAIGHCESSPNEEKNMNQTSRISSILIASLICMLTTACTTIKPVYDNPQASIASQLKPGDRVRITLINDQAKEIDIKGLIHKSSSTQQKGATVEQEWPDIFSVETVKISPIKTAGAAVGIVAALPFVALGAMFMGAGY